MNNLMTKSFLSYQDLKKEALKDLESGDPRASLELTSSALDDNLRLFFEEATLIKDEIASMRDILASIQLSHDHSKSLHKPEPLKLIRQTVNSHIIAILKKAKSIRSRLESMDLANAANRRLSGYREGTPVDRTRTQVTNGLRKKLKELMMEFQDLRQRMMAEHKETVERRYFTITGQVPEDEVIERVIANGESEKMLEKAVAEQGRGKVAETVHEIQGRHEAAKEIERSLLELHQVFLDMAVMVETQGERMEDIEHHVVNAAHYVRDGAKELRTAKEYQKGSRKWLCVGVVLLMVLVLVILVPILASLRGS